MLLPKARYQYRMATASFGNHWSRFDWNYFVSEASRHSRWSILNRNHELGA